MKKFDEISEALNTETDIVDVTPTESAIEKPVRTDSDEQIKKDYEYTRGNLYSIIEKGQESLDGIMELAQQSDSPRAYEVAGQLIKNVSDATDKLIDLQKKMKELNKDEEGPKSVTNNALFVGSTAELAKFLKQQK
tara:strand:- start:90 stop:497 length:408 start_codon:yes stop_codon:yes gene_type:complete